MSGHEPGSAAAPRAQAGRPLTGAEILANARALAGRIRERELAARYDELRNLPADIRDAGIMRMNMPKIYEILDTWYTTGLRGTGSNDYRREDVFVP